jgi:hypothetical protein
MSVSSEYGYKIAFKLRQSVRPLNLLLDYRTETDSSSSTRNKASDKSTSYVSYLLQSTYSHQRNSSILNHSLLLTAAPQSSAVTLICCHSNLVYSPYSALLLLSLLNCALICSVPALPALFWSCSPFSSVLYSALLLLSLLYSAPFYSTLPSPVLLRPSLLCSAVFCSISPYSILHNSALLCSYSPCSYSPCSILSLSALTRPALSTKRTFL